jgi:hypothetical protein
LALKVDRPGAEQHAILETQRLGAGFLVVVDRIGKGSSIKVIWCAAPARDAQLSFLPGASQLL